jgi:hypothetical protein
MTGNATGGERLYCAKQEPGPGGPSRALALLVGAEATPLSSIWQRNQEKRSATPAAVKSLPVTS